MLHRHQDNNESSTHEELPPVEVRPPGVTQQIAQLLMNGVMPRERHCLGLSSLGGWNDVLTVPKDVLHLQQMNIVQACQ